MPTRAAMMNVLAKWALMVAALAALFFQSARGQSNSSKASAGAKTATAGAANNPAESNPSDVAKTLKTAAEALGLARWSGVGGQRLPEVDVINTMEIRGSGTTYGAGPSSKPGEPGPAIKTDYHVTLGYNPPAMRVEMTRTGSGGAPQHTFEVVRDTYAWDESEVGGGLVAGKGTATPTMAAVNNRLLQLWILPYGVIKAALAAGDKTKVSNEKGATVITFPLSGQLAAVMVKATLDAQNEIERVEKRIIAIEAERTLIELELCKDPMHKGLQAQHADLTREAASLETRWMEVGTAIEEAEALTAQCQTQRR